jgi:hypothetical protein
MDDLSPSDQRMISRSLFGIVFGYTAIILLLFAIVIVRHRLADDGVDTASCAAPLVTSGAVRRGGVAASGSAAAEANRIGRPSHDEAGPALPQAVNPLRSRCD